MTEATIEDKLLTTLSSKRDLAMAALDPDAQVTDVDVRSQADDIKAKLEVLLGAKPEAPVDETVKETAARAAREERLAATGSRCLDAALDLLGGRDAGGKRPRLRAPRKARREDRQRRAWRAPPFIRPPAA